MFELCGEKYYFMYASPEHTYAILVRVRDQYTIAYSDDNIYVHYNECLETGYNYCSLNINVDCLDKDGIDYEEYVRLAKDNIYSRLLGDA